MTGSAAPPPGYARARVGGAEAVAIEPLLPGICAILSRTTLYEHAAAHPERRVRTGRAPVYIVPLDGSELPVVVRHSWHGGAIARVTGDRFLAPTRAPYELAMSLQLLQLGVATPRVVGYATYPAAPMVRRSDVITDEVPGASDLAAVLAGSAPHIGRRAAVMAAADLLTGMARAGVRHPDLNLKNILIAPEEDGTLRAYVLDVDRVHIDASRARAAAANAARLTRSARKWRRLHGAPITDAEVAAIEIAALGGRT